MSEQRKYSIAEIDQMRDLIADVIIPPGTPYNPEEKSRAAEDRLRTLMLNGSSVEDVVAWHRNMVNEHQRFWLRQR